MNWTPSTEIHQTSENQLIASNEFAYINWMPFARHTQNFLPFLSRSLDLSGCCLHFRPVYTESACRRLMHTAPGIVVNYSPMHLFSNHPWWAIHLMCTKSTSLVWAGRIRAIITKHFSCTRYSLNLTVFPPFPPSPFLLSMFQICVRIVHVHFLTLFIIMKFLLWLLSLLLKSFSFEMPIGTVHHPPIDVKIPAQSTGIEYLDTECIHIYIYMFMLCLWKK